MTSLAASPGVFQILSPEGTEVGDVPASLARGDLVSIYSWMSFTRAFDTRMVKLQRQGRIAIYGPTTGQEAVPVGAAFALEPQDWILPALREQVIALIRGLPLSTYVAQLLGNANDLSKGRQLPCHPTWRAGNYVSMSPCIATQVPHAVGVAMAMKFRKARSVSLGFLGDGATSEGDFHVAMNFAAVFRAPVVIVCQNNHWSITVPVSLQTASETIAAKAGAYGMPGVRVDGNDALAVYAAVKEAAGKAREGGGPTFIEAVTYRMLAHTTSDDPSRYRDEREVEPWRARDPILRMRQFLSRRGLWDPEREQALERQNKERIDAALLSQEGAPGPAPATLFDDVYARVTDDLARAREEILPSPGEKG